jgi:peptidoglycan biosynthesis protein MviN/MurJ (putative lipid II flippase)
MFWASGAMVGGCVGNALMNSFLAQGDTRTPTKVAMVALTIGLGAKIAACYVAGIKGMAVSDTVCSIAACSVLGLILKKRLKAYTSSPAPADFLPEANRASAGV